jgi:peptidoglycan hydrolase-like protein with peptidoglycan-binding domain
MRTFQTRDGGGRSDSAGFDGMGPGKLSLVQQLEQAPPANQAPANQAQPESPSASPVVQLQEEAPADKLTAAQAALAVSFYRGKPELYTEDVIRKIQQSVKSPETGKPDAAMAQGVARFQDANVLKVDGMAGPRTLPRMFHSGLATETNRKAFVASGKAVEAEWTKLATARARAEKLFEGVKPILDAEKVPTPKVELGDTGKAAGVFSGKRWTITFDQTVFSAASIDDDTARDVSGTVYHEARHAEQQHKMARMLATRGNSSAQIHAKMGIPTDIADDAFGNKLPKGIEFATAAQQYDSEFGAGKAHFEQAERDAPSNDDLKAAQAAAAKDPSPANKAKLARVLAAYRAYHDLPTENDAFNTENDLSATWDETTAEATPPAPVPAAP